MMFREPAVVPLKRGVFALVNKKRRFAYIAFTSNLQKRSHSMSHMLLAQDKSKKAYWPIKDLPKHPSDEFTFVVERQKGVTNENSMAQVALVQRAYQGKGYKVIDGQRSASPMVTYKGKKMSLVDAIKASGSKVKYLTAYRRLERGWSVEQALGLEAPAPRWHKKAQAERRAREAERAGED